MCVWAAERELPRPYHQRGEIELDPEKVRLVQEFPVPKTVQQVRSFLGLANYIIDALSKILQKLLLL